MIEYKIIKVFLSTSESEVGGRRSGKRIHPDKDFEDSGIKININDIEEKSKP